MTTGYWLADIDNVVGGHLRTQIDTTCDLHVFVKASDGDSRYCSEKERGTDVVTSVYLDEVDLANVSTVMCVLRISDVQRAFQIAVMRHSFTRINPKCFRFWSVLVPLVAVR